MTVLAPICVFVSALGALRTLAGAAVFFPLLHPGLRIDVHSAVGIDVDLDATLVSNTRVVVDELGLVSMVVVPFLASRSWVRGWLFEGPCS